MTLTVGTATKASQVFSPSQLYVGRQSITAGLVECRMSSVCCWLTLQAAAVARAGQVQSHEPRAFSGFSRWVQRLKTLGHLLLVSQAISRKLDGT